MTRLKKNFYLLILTFILIISCKSDDDFSSNVSQDIQIQDFIWRGLNTYYLWQEDVSNLDDSINDESSSYESYLNSNSDPYAFFNSLLNEPGTVDRFSWIVDDYIALENSLVGITENNGVEYGLVFEENSDTNIYGYVRYILPDSDASTKNIQRGDIFHAINGQELTLSNYSELLGQSSYTLNLANYNNGNPTDNGVSVSLTKSEYEENPIYLSKVITHNGLKIGYLMYNAFNRNYNNELNTVFADFQAEGINKLVLDLRYNGGGSVSTASYLASMITGQFNNQVFTKNIWNSKIQPILEADDDDSIYINRFTDSFDGNSINSISMNDIYIITSFSTASASELVINGLNPYINVTTIGKTTRGKHVGSITLYDSENFSRNNVNPSHTWAMQPITFEAQNSANESSPSGFIPTIDLGESYDNLGIIGQIDEPLLARAIQFITTGTRSTLNIHSSVQKSNREFKNSKDMLVTKDNMYLD